MDIYSILKEDHEKVRQLVNQLVNLNEGEDEARGKLISQIRDELVPHSRAEESVFYNSLREIKTAKDLVGHAFKEHMEAEMTLRMLQLRDKMDITWKETAQNLKEQLEHHIQHEEGVVFKAAQTLFTEEEANMFGEAFQRLKDEVETEGFLKNTVDMVANMMPQRFAEMFRTRSLRPEKDKAS